MRSNPFLVKCGIDVMKEMLNKYKCIQRKRKNHMIIITSDSVGSASDSHSVGPWIEAHLV